MNNPNHNTNQHHVLITYADEHGKKMATVLSGIIEKRDIHVILDGSQMRDKNIIFNYSALHMDKIIAILPEDDKIPEYLKFIWALAWEYELRLLSIIAHMSDRYDVLRCLPHLDFTAEPSADFMKKLMHWIHEDTQKNNLKWYQKPIREFAVHVEHGQKVACVSPSTTVSAALDMIRDAHYTYRHLLVTEGGEARQPMKGLVSHRQLDKQVWKHGHDNNVTVEQVMDVFTPEMERPTPTFIYLKENDTVEQALKLFRQEVTVATGVNDFHYMSAIPLVDDNYNAVGIISFKDIISRMISGEFPTPKVTVGEIRRLRYHQESPNRRIVDVYDRIKQLGQRDIPIVDDNPPYAFLGFVPDQHLSNPISHPNDRLFNIMVDVERLKCQPLDRSIKDLLPEYHPDSKVYYTVPVVAWRGKIPFLLGLVGYQEIFGALLSLAHGDLEPDE